MKLTKLKQAPTLLALAVGALALSISGHAKASGSMSILERADIEPTRQLIFQHQTTDEELAAQPGKKIRNIQVRISTYRGYGNALMLGDVQIALLLNRMSQVYDVRTAHCEASAGGEKLTCSSNENEGGDNEFTIVKSGTDLRISFKTPSAEANRSPRILAVTKQLASGCEAGSQPVSPAMGDSDDDNFIGSPTPNSCGIELRDAGDLDLNIKL